MTETNGANGMTKTTRPPSEWEESDFDAMVRDMCAAVDQHDFSYFGSYFADAAYYRFGNAEPVVGQAAIIAATAAAIAVLPPLHHVVDQVARVGRQLFCRFTIEVETNDETLRLPCVTVIELELTPECGTPIIVDYRVHMDISPAFVTAPA